MVFLLTILKATDEDNKSRIKPRVIESRTSHSSIIIDSDILVIPSSGKCNFF